MRTSNVGYHMIEFIPQTPDVVPVAPELDTPGSN